MYKIDRILNIMVLRLERLKYFLECLNGIYGKNCLELCLVNMYGELCLKRCYCKLIEECNREYGCLSII